MANDVLLTGGTGVVGAALVPELAAKKQDVVIHLLVRARDESDLARRADELHGYWRSCGQPIDPGRTRFYRGDVTQPRLGLDDRDYAALSACVTHVIHSAGNVRLNESLADARRSAVDSARHIVEFARRGLQQGVLGKVDALSTIGVAGRLRGIVPERRLTERRSFRNTYEAAKAEAEELLWREIDAGMPLTIHRPSMVVGDSRTGRAIRPQVFRYLADFLSGRRTGGFLPRLGTAALDVVPSDFVAQALAASAFAPEMAGRVLHLCSGPERELPLAVLSQEVRRLFQSMNVPLPPVRLLPRSVFGALALVLSLVAPQAQRRSLRTAPYFLAYLNSPQSFGSSATLRLLGAMGVELPPPQFYLDRILSALFRDIQAER